MSRLNSFFPISKLHLERILKWCRKIASFFVGQVTLQFLTALSGFVIVRALSKSEYSVYSIAFAFQSVMGTLIDMAFSSSIVALVGNKADDKSVIQGFIGAALHVRRKLFISVSTISLIFFIVLFRGKSIRLADLFLLYSGLLFYLYNQKYIIMLAVFKIKGLIRPLYIYEISILLLRLLVIILLSINGILNALLLVWLLGLQCLLLGIIVNRRIKTHIDVSLPKEPAYEKRLFEFVKPFLPNIVFFAFQGQIAVGIVAYFGNVAHVAELSALGRISQIFTAVSGFSMVIVEPYFAKIPIERVVSRYILISFIYISVFLALISIGYWFSTPMLSILGVKYAHSNLEFPLFIMIISGCISQLGVLFWLMNQSRHWNYAWNSWLIIVMTISVQIVTVKMIDMHSVLSASWFQLWSNLSTTTALLIGGIYSISKLKLEMRNQ